MRLFVTAPEAFVVQLVGPWTDWGSSDRVSAVIRTIIQHPTARALPRACILQMGGERHHIFHQVQGAAMDGRY